MIARAQNLKAAPASSRFFWRTAAQAQTSLVRSGPITSAMVWFAKGGSAITAAVASRQSRNWRCSCAVNGFFSPGAFSAWTDAPNNVAPIARAVRVLLNTGFLRCHSLPGRQPLHPVLAEPVVERLRHDVLHGLAHGTAAVRRLDRGARINPERDRLLALPGKVPTSPEHCWAAVPRRSSWPGRAGSADVAPRAPVSWPQACSPAAAAHMPRAGLHAFLVRLWAGQPWSPSQIKTTTCRERANGPAVASLAGHKLAAITHQVTPACLATMGS